MAVYIRSTTAAQRIRRKFKVDIKHVVDVLATIPDEELKPIRRGYWIGGYIDDNGNESFQCSECNDFANEQYKSCPNCSADMREEF